MSMCSTEPFSGDLENLEAAGREARYPPVADLACSGRDNLHQARLCRRRGDHAAARPEGHPAGEDQSRLDRLYQESPSFCLNRVQ
jgi:hypothetical protein